MATAPQANPQGFPQIQAPIAGENGYITTAWLYLLQTLWQRTGGGSGGAIVPSGIAVFSPSGQVPGGWYELAGQTITQANDPTLFAIYGSTLPDMRGRMGLGANGSHAVGTTGGSETVSLTTSQLPSHSHTITDPGHSHPSVVASSTNTAGAAAGTTVAGSTGNATTGITATDNTGSGNPITTISPFYTGKWIVKR